MFVKVFYEVGIYTKSEIGLYSICETWSEKNGSGTCIRINRAVSPYYSKHSCDDVRKALTLFAGFLSGQQQQMLRLPSFNSTQPESITGWTLDLTQDQIKIIEVCEPIDPKGQISLSGTKTMAIERASPQP